MAALTSHHQMIETLCARVRAHVGGLKSLADALSREAEHLARKNQADSISALRARVTEGVAHILLAEDEASSDFTRRKERKAAAHRVVGVIQAFLTDKDFYVEHHVRLAEAELARSAPFRTVFVQIDPHGIPDGVSIVSVSRLARESGTPAAQIRSRLAAKGCHLMAPGTFIGVLDRLQGDVLEGSAVLPLTCEQLGVYLASGAPKRTTVHLPVSPNAVSGASLIPSSTGQLP